MAVNGLGLGKGLDALIRETSSGSRDGERGVVSVKDIAPNPDQPRRHFSEKALEELAASIKSQGLLQPILVRPVGDKSAGRYEIIAGERRWRASQLAGLSEVPVVVKNFSAQETLVAALVENLQREDLNPLEEALGIQMLKEEFDLSQEELSHKLGKSRSAIANCLRLLSLPSPIQAEVASGRISAGHARTLLSITDEQAQSALKEKIIKEGLAVREAEAMASLWKEHGSFDVQGEMVEPDGNNGMNPAGRVRPRNGSTGKKPQCVKLMEAQRRLASALGQAVRVTGSEHSGKINIAFSSPEELDTLLARLESAAGARQGA